MKHPIGINKTGEKPYQNPRVEHRWKYASASLCACASEPNPELKSRSEPGFRAGSQYRHRHESQQPPWKRLSRCSAMSPVGAVPAAAAAAAEVLLAIFQSSSKHNKQTCGYSGDDDGGDLGDPQYDAVEEWQNPTSFRFLGHISPSRSYKVIDQ